MTPEKTLEILSPLLVAFPRFDMTEETLALYVERLRGESELDLTEAVGRAIDSSRFMPSIGEIHGQIRAIGEARRTAPVMWKGPHGGPRSCDKDDNPMTPADTDAE